MLAHAGESLAQRKVDEGAGVAISPAACTCKTCKTTRKVDDLAGEGSVAYVSYTIQWVNPCLSFVTAPCAGAAWLRTLALSPAR